MRALPLFGLVLLLAVPGCGGGTIGDLFGAFPPEAFEPPGDGGPGDPGTPPGAFPATEVAFLDDAQGVTGDVRNVALATVGARTIAFLAAGPNGCHVADVSEPERVNNTSFLTTIRDANLTAPAALAGGRVDAVAVIDNTFVVLVAVGSGAANAVTVFQIPTLLGAATSPSADLSAAFVAGTGDIAVPGTAAGKAGGVAGAASSFFVATGGADLGVGIIAPGTPPTWSAQPPYAAPRVDRFLDAAVNFPSVFASVQTGTEFGFVALSVQLTPTPTLTPADPDPITLDGEFQMIADDIISGPGNHPLALTVDANTLFLGGDDEVHLFNVTNPASPANSGLALGTGVDTIAVDASGGFFGVGAGRDIRVYSILTGQPTLAAQLQFAANFTVRGVALTNSEEGRFLLCCAGDRGLRVVQWSNVP